MALPAVKGAIIVGGVAIALSVALYEHEPTREWFKERGRDINQAFEDFLDEIHPERRRRQAFGEGQSSSYTRNSTDRRQFPWNFRRQTSEEPRRDFQSAASGTGVDAPGSTALRRRRGSGALELDEMSRQVASDEAILEQAGPDSARQSSEMDRASYQHLLPARESSLQSSSTFGFVSAQEARQPSVISVDEDRAMLTPSTSHGALSELGGSEGSIEFIRTPTSTRPGSVADPFDDEDTRSNTTETMSQVSRDDDVRSVASSWSHVSDDDLARAAHA